jgi:hypothetical protein
MVNNLGKAFGSSEIIFTIVILVFTVFCVINDKMWKKKEYDHIYENNKTD